MCVSAKMIGSLYWMTKILIGIDTGVNTGFAVAADRGNGGELEQVESLSITQAMEKVKALIEEW